MANAHECGSVEDIPSLSEAWIQAFSPRNISETDESMKIA